MDYDLTWLEEIGVDISEGLEYTRHIDKYISSLQKYYKNYKTNCNKMREYYDNKDWKNYCIVAHSLKSNSRMIGAKTFADKFEKLEHASRAEDVNTIDSMHNILLSEWSEFAGKLSKIEDYSEDVMAEELSFEEAKRTAGKLMEALDDFDDVTSKELVLKLSGYPFSEELKERLKEASDYIDDFLYDDALEIIREFDRELE